MPPVLRGRLRFGASESAAGSKSGSSAGAQAPAGLAARPPAHAAASSPRTLCPGPLIGSEQGLLASASLPSSRERLRPASAPAAAATAPGPGAGLSTACAAGAVRFCARASDSDAAPLGGLAALAGSGLRPASPCPLLPPVGLPACARARPASPAPARLPPPEPALCTAGSGASLEPPRAVPPLRDGAVPPLLRAAALLLVGLARARSGPPLLCAAAPLPMGLAHAPLAPFPAPAAACSSCLSSRFAGCGMPLGQRGFALPAPRPASWSGNPMCTWNAPLSGSALRLALAQYASGCTRTRLLARSGWRAGLPGSPGGQSPPPDLFFLARLAGAACAQAPASLPDPPSAELPPDPQPQPALPPTAPPDEPGLARLAPGASPLAGESLPRFAAAPPSESPGAASLSSLEHSSPSASRGAQLSHARRCSAPPAGAAAA